MAQHDYVIENQAGAAFRADINEVLQAIVTNNAGTTAPNPTFPHQWWADTTAGVLKRRNAANDAWISMGALDSASLSANQNLNDVENKATAFNNIKQLATTTSTGVVEKATQAELTNGTADKFPDAAAVRADINAVLATVSVKPVPVRQTVLTGPVDVNGRADFLSATGLTVETSGEIILTVGDGFNSNGEVNLVATIPAGTDWSMPDNATRYLMLEITSAGVITERLSSAAPIYSAARPATGEAANQLWYPTDHRSRAERWDGGAWVKTNFYICLGQVATSSGSAVSLISYAYQGFTISSEVTGSYGLSAVFAHNMGTTLVSNKLNARVITASAGFSVGHIIDMSNGYSHAGSDGAGLSLTSTSINTLGLGINPANFYTQRTAGTGAVQINPNTLAFSVITKRAF